MGGCEVGSAFQNWMRMKSVSTPDWPIAFQRTSRSIIPALREAKTRGRQWGFVRAVPSKSNNRTLRFQRRRGSAYAGAAFSPLCNKIFVVLPLPSTAVWIPSWICDVEIVLCLSSSLHAFRTSQICTSFDDTFGSTQPVFGGVFRSIREVLAPHIFASVPNSDVCNARRTVSQVLPPSILERPESSVPVGLRRPSVVYNPARPQSCQATGWKRIHRMKTAIGLRVRTQERFL